MATINKALASDSKAVRRWVTEPLLVLANKYKTRKQCKRKQWIAQVQETDLLLNKLKPAALNLFDALETPDKTLSDLMMRLSCRKCSMLPYNNGVFSFIHHSVH